MADITHQDLLALEKKLLERQDKIEQKSDQLEKDKEYISEKREEYQQKLEKVSGLTKEEARQALLTEIENDSAAMMARIIKEKEEEAKATADLKSREILVDAM